MKKGKSFGSKMFKKLQMLIATGQRLAPIGLSIAFTISSFYMFGIQSLNNWFIETMPLVNDIDIIPLQNLWLEHLTTNKFNNSQQSKIACYELN